MRQKLQNCVYVLHCHWTNPSTISTTLTTLTHLLAAMDGTRGHDPSLLPLLRTGPLTRTAVTNNSAIQHQCRSSAATTSLQRRQLLAETRGDGKSSQQSFPATLRKHERKINQRLAYATTNSFMYAHWPALTTVAHTPADRHCSLLSAGALLMFRLATG